MNANKAVEVKLPGAVADASGLHKLENYYGIEFERGASNGGGKNGYHAMIGDADLLAQLTFHNLIQMGKVKDGKVTTYLNSVNLNQTKSGGVASLDGADGNDVMQIFPKLYAIIGGTDPTYERYIISDEEFSYGNDVAQEIEFHGETPDYEVIYNSISRSIVNTSAKGSSAAGQGSNYSDTNFGKVDGGGFPTTQTSRYMYEAYARAKNEDNTLNTPYSNIYTGDLELVMAMLFIECRTKDINSVFGHGISSNVAPTAQTWGSVTGLRTDLGSGNYQYFTWGSPVWVNGTQMNLWSAFNESMPLTRILEAQLAVSNGEALEAVKNSDGQYLQSVGNGVMTGIWTKSMSFTLNCALTNGGEAASHVFEIVLRVPIWRGRNRLYGNLTQHYSGYEVINWLDVDGVTVHNTLYRAPSAKAMVTDTVETASSKDVYSFVSVYDEVGDIGVCQAWVKESMSLASKGITVACGKTPGGVINNYESAFTYTLNTATQGSFRRRCSLFGEYASNSLAVLRVCHVHLAPSPSSSDIGSGFRVSLSE